MIEIKHKDTGEVLYSTDLDSLVGVNLQNEDFDLSLMGADLSGMDLTGAYLSLVNLRDSDLTGAILTGAILECADFRGANITNTDFTNSELTWANLYGLDLSLAIGIDKAYTNFVNYTHDCDHWQFITKENGERYLTPM